jgi:hypothetical protein
MESRSRAALASTDPRVRAVLQDYFTRIDGGETVEIEAFVSQHPDIADELRSGIALDEDSRRARAFSSRCFDAFDFRSGRTNCQRQTSIRISQSGEVG